MARGGKRPGAGRKPGSKSKVTRKLTALQGRSLVLCEAAKVYTEPMLGVLATIALDEEATESARVTAAIHVLDRGHGKPPQAIEHSGKAGGPIETKDVSEVSELEIARRIAFVLTAAANKSSTEKG